MKTVILMLCAAIAFVPISDPRQEKSEASFESSDQLAKVLDKLSGNDVAMLELICNQGLELAKIEECQSEEVSQLKSQLVSIKESVDAPKAETGCDCGCEEKYTELTKRLASLETFKSNYPSVGAVGGLGSTGSTVKSGGSAGSIASGGSSGEVLNRSRTPLRTAVNTVTAPLRSSMTQEEMMDLHDAMHEGDGIDRPGHLSFPGDIASHLQGHADNRVQPGSTSYPNTAMVTYGPRVLRSQGDCPGGVCPTNSKSSSRWYLGKALGR